MNQKHTPIKPQKLVETKDLMFIWKVLIKNIGILILVPILAYIIGYVYTYRLTEVYGSKVQLLVKSNDTYDYQDPIYKGLGAYGAYMDLQNQMRIIQSRDFIGEIVDKIDANVSYSTIGRLKKKEVFETLPFTVDTEVIATSIYETSMTIEVINLNQYNLSYSIGGVEKNITANFDELFLNEDLKITLKRQYRYTKQNINSITAIKYEIKIHDRDNLINKYRSRISIANIEHTSILEINILDDLQYRGKRFLDTLTVVYVDFSKRNQLEVNKNTLVNIERQIDTVSKFIQDKELELLKYKDENTILHLSKEENDNFNKYIEYSKLKRELSHKESSLKSLESYILNVGDEHLLPPSLIVLKEDIYLTSTITKIYETQLLLNNRLNYQLPSNEGVINLKKSISALKKDVLIYIEDTKKIYTNEILEVNNFINENKIDIKKIPVLEQGISNIKRELDVNNKMYLFLLEKKTNTLITRAGIIPQVRIVENASTLGIVQPDKGKIKRLFVLGGIIFALFIAVVRKLFFEKIENVAELAEATHLNIIGGIPLIKELESKLIVTQKPKAQITESFRTLRTNLSYLGETKVDNEAKVILVSSFFPGEGKTFTSTNSASLMAMSDKKVLIIDFDLHKPKVHKTFSIQNTIGVSSFLIGKNTIEEIIHKDKMPNLDVITAGPIPPNPSELILKNEMAVMFDKLKKEYDFIIIDTPPFGLLNDAIELIKFVDTFIVVLNTQFARRKGIRTIEEILGKNNSVSYGLVLNRVKKTKFQYYYSKYTYKYNYNYGYNYGYGYGDSYSDYVSDD